MQVGEPVSAAQLFPADLIEPGAGPVDARVEPQPLGAPINGARPARLLGRLALLASAAVRSRTSTMADDPVPPSPRVPALQQRPPHPLHDVCVIALYNGEPVASGVVVGGQPTAQFRAVSGD